MSTDRDTQIQLSPSSWKLFQDDVVTFRKTSYVECNFKPLKYFSLIWRFCAIFLCSDILWSATNHALQSKKYNFLLRVVQVFFPSNSTFGIFKNLYVFIMLEYVNVFVPIGRHLLFIRNWTVFNSWFKVAPELLFSEFPSVAYIF